MSPTSGVAEVSKISIVALWNMGVGTVIMAKNCKCCKTFGRNVLKVIFFYKISTEYVSSIKFIKVVELSAEIMRYILAFNWFTKSQLPKAEIFLCALINLKINQTVSI